MRLGTRLLAGALLVMPALVTAQDIAQPSDVQLSAWPTPAGGDVSVLVNPEPSTIVLLGGGVVALGLWARRRRRE